MSSSRAASSPGAATDKPNCPECGLDRLTVVLDLPYCEACKWAASRPVGEVWS